MNPSKARGGIKKIDLFGHQASDCIRISSVCRFTHQQNQRLGIFVCQYLLLIMRAITATNDSQLVILCCIMHCCGEFPDIDGFTVASSLNQSMEKLIVVADCSIAFQDVSESNLIETASSS